MNRSFYALLTSQTATNLGFALYTMVVVLHLYHATGSTAWSAAVPLISISCKMISSLVLPSLADRVRLPRLLMFSQIAQLVLLLVLCLLILQTYSTLNMLLIFAVLSVISFFNGFFAPVKTTLVKVLVPEDQRVKANSLLASIDQTFLFGGWTAGGLYLSWFGKETTLITTFSLIVVSIGALSLIQGVGAVTVRTTEPWSSRMTEGWRLLFRHRGLKVLAMMEIIEAFVGSIWIGAVTLTYVEVALQEGEAWWGYINGGYYLGTIIGGLLVYRYAHLIQSRLTTFTIIGSLLFGGMVIVYGMVSNAYLALLLAFLMGPPSQARDLSQETMFQKSADDQALTKILAAKSTIVQFIYIISIVCIGILTDVIGVRFVYMLSGGLLLLSSLYGFYQLVVRNQRTYLETDTGI